jgi:diacylglycerol kinase family enzyme
MFPWMAAIEEPPAPHGRSDWHDTVFAHTGSSPPGALRAARTTGAGSDTGRSGRPAADRRAATPNPDPAHGSSAAGPDLTAGAVIEIDAEDLPQSDRRRRAFVLLNDRAGGAGRQGIAGEIERLSARLGLDATIGVVRGADIAAAAGRAVETGDWDVIVAAGGDGTVNGVVTGVTARVPAGEAPPIGVLPLGTLNHFAKDLGIPLGLEAALGVLATGMVRRVDVADVNGRPFVNNSALGLYPALVTDRDRQRRHRRRRKWLAYAIAAFRLAFRFPMLRIDILQDGVSRGVSTPLVFIGNNSYRMDLFAFGSRATLDGGTLSVYLVKRRSRLGMLGLLLAGLIGRLDQARDFESHQVEEIEITARRRRLKLSVDGEVVAFRPPLIYRIHPHGLAVIVPRTAP